MLQNVVQLPQSFFDTTPLGRVLNRFSKDQYTIDEVLPRSFNGFFRTLFSVISVLAVNSFGSKYYILFAIPLAVLYMYFQKFYLSTSRELKRLDSTSRSPIFAHFQETLGGVSTIRAYKCENRFIATNESRIDFNQKAYYPSISSNRWLAIRLEFIGALIVFGSALFSVFTIWFNGSIPASIIGLMLTYSLSVTQTLNWLVRQSCEIETNIVSVERIKEYADLPREAPHFNDFKIPEGWPTEGTVGFHDYCTRYREGLNLVLKGLDIKVKPMEKIGIVGRTGAGKSSLTFALFRLIEAASGFITIDSVDIARIGLRALRSKLTIIPQDPVLFAGTIRDNLDPYGLKSDLELWEALEDSNLKEYVQTLPGTLSYIILQGEEIMCGP
jgi:ABC-type multidrug transport system fused ATPase/permease subunit